jgi:hypothetical protein
MTATGPENGRSPIGMIGYKADIEFAHSAGSTFGAAFVGKKRPQSARIVQGSGNR